MKEIELLTEMCLKINDLLRQLYQNGQITKEVYLEHTRMKYYFLNNLPSRASDDARGKNSQ